MQMYKNVDNVCYLYIVGMLIIGLDVLTLLFSLFSLSNQLGIYILAHGL